MLAAAAGQSPRSSGGGKDGDGRGSKPVTLSALQRYGLEHRVDLLEGPSGSTLGFNTLHCMAVGCSIVRTCWGAQAGSSMYNCSVGGLAGATAIIPWWLAEWLTACLPFRPTLAADTDLLEMRQEVEAALESASGVGGWLVELVGGSRRQQRPGGEQERTDRPHHDAGGWLSFFSYVML